MGPPKSDWLNEYDCHLRMTIGELMTGDDHADLWWSLDDDDAVAKADVAIRNYGLPWLDQFPSKHHLLTAFETHGPFPLGMSPAGALDIAQLYVGLDRQLEARRTLENYVKHPVGAGHADYLQGYLREIGQADLADRVTREQELHLGEDFEGD